MFFEIFQHLFSKLKSKLGYRKTLKEIGSIKIIDSPTIGLCLSLFPWAKFRKTKGGIKLHTLYDLNTEAPENIIISNAIIHDKKIFDNLSLNPSYTYIFDRAYIDYQKFDNFVENDIYFVTKAKSNTAIETMRVVELTDKDKESNVLIDATVILGKYNTDKRMKHELRLVKVKTTDRNGNDKEIKILTNRFDLPAHTIAQLYKERWEIELFFKWVKQHLKIKRFFGQNKNAVLTQIYSAAILLLILKLIKKQSKFKGSLLKLTRILKYSILTTINSPFNWETWLMNS